MRVSFRALGGCGGGFVRQGLWKTFWVTGMVLDWYCEVGEGTEVRFEEARLLISRMR